MRPNGEMHQGKCIVCSSSQGKYMFLGLKSNTLEKHVESGRPLKICHMFGLRKTYGILTKNVTMCRIKLVLQAPIIQ